MPRCKLFFRMMAAILTRNKKAFDKIVDEVEEFYERREKDNGPDS